MAAFLVETTTRPAGARESRDTRGASVSAPSSRLASTREISRPLLPPPPPPPPSPSRCTRPPGLYGATSVTQRAAFAPPPKASQPSRAERCQASWWKLPRGDATTSLERRSRNKRPAGTPRARNNSARVAASNACRRERRFRSSQCRCM